MKLYHLPYLLLGLLAYWQMRTHYMNRIHELDATVATLEYKLGGYQ